METVDRFLFTSDTYKHVEHFWSGWLNKFQDGFTFIQKNKSTQLFSERKEFKFKLGETVYERITKLSGQNPNNIYVCLLSAFAIIISKCTDEHEIIIDSPLHRNVDTDKAYAFSVPMMIELQAKKSLRENMLSIQQAVKNFYKFQNYPREKMLASSIGKVCKTNFLFYYEPIHHQLVDDSHQYDLRVDMTSDTSFIHFSVLYSPDCFDDAFIEAIPHYLESLFSYLDKMDTVINEIEILSTDKKSHILSDFNLTEHAFPYGKSIPDIFEEKACMYPNTPAVVYEGRTLTYQQLNETSDKLAYYLVKQFSINRGDFVGVIMDKSELIIIGIIATLKAGAAYVPIDPKLPKERVEYIIQDTKLKAVLTQIDYLYSFPEVTSKMFLMDVELEALEAPTENWKAKIDPESPAYVIYTSGSTGIPKGVVIKHFSVINLITWQAKQYAIENKKNVLQFFSFSFDGAVGETFMALLNGATLHMFNSNKLNSDDLTNFINENNISVGVFVPSLLKQLDASRIKNRNMWVVSVGEECSPELARIWSSVCRFANAYGPSEYTVYSHLYEVQKDEIRNSIPIGKPILNTKSYILDENLNVVPEGVVGEIYISGAGLYDSYLNNRRLTLEKLKPNPFVLADKFEEKGMLYFESAAFEINSFKNKREKAGIENKIQEAQISSKDEILTLEDGLDEDLISTSKKYLDECAVEQKFKSFRRYFLEGFNDSYSSCGINEHIFKTLIPFDNYQGLHGIDLGFGNAEVMLLVESMGGLIKGVELSPFLVQKARNKGLQVMMGEVDKVTSDFLTDYNLEADSLDFSFSNLVLDRIEYPNRLVKNLLSVLKPGGKFAIQTLLPIVPIDDGEVGDKIIYTSDENLITSGLQVREDKLSIVEILYQAGAQNISVYQLPYVVASRDGVQEYIIWSFTGTKGTIRDIHDCIYNKMYRTGDLGTYLPDGRVDFTGRVDEQIKLRGFRIELGEIEKVLLNSGKFKDIKIVVKEDHADEKILVACYVSDELINHEEMREFLKAKLPEYMIPSYFISLKSLPLNNSGKFDKGALPELWQSGEMNNFIKTENATEEQLHKIWSSILNSTNISTSANFFSIGGHSLKATQLVYLIHKEMGIKLDLSFVFEYPTIKKMASELAKEVKTEYQSIQPLTPQAHYALSSAQQRIWLSTQLGADPRIYNVPVVYTIKGKLDIDAFCRSFKSIIQRHEILRTILVNVDNLPRQFVLGEHDEKFNISFLDIRNPETGKCNEKDFINEEQMRIFDLYKGPLVIIKLLKTGIDDFILLLNFHHIIIDGWSMNIFISEILRLYDHYKNNQPISLLPLGIQYKDYASWQKEQLTNSASVDAKNYWVKKFCNGMHRVELLTDYPRLHDKEYNGSVLIFPIEGGLYDAMNGLAQENNVSKLCVALTFIKILLNKYTGLREIVVGTPVSGRDHADLEGQIGIFLNILPLVTEVNPEDTFLTMLYKVKATLFDAYRYQYYPFERIIDDIDMSVPQSKSSGIDILVQMSDEEPTENTNIISDLAVEPYPFYNEVSQYDLTFFFNYKDVGMSLKIEYKTSLFKASTIEKVAKDYMKLVSAVANNPHYCVADLQLSDDSETNGETAHFLKNMQGIVA